jgi:hypothetical protein
MVKEYRALLGLDRLAANDRPRPKLFAEAIVREAAVRRYLREEWIRLEAARPRLERQLAHANLRATAQEKRADAQEKRANAQEERANAQEERANAQEKRANAQEERANAQEERANAQEERANAQQARADVLKAQLATVEATRDAILASTSWRLTRPLRVAIDLLRPGAPPTAPENEVVLAPSSLPAGVEAAQRPISGSAMQAQASDAGAATVERGPAAASPRAGGAASRPLRLSVRHGDILAWAYARQLLQRLGVDEDKTSEPVSAPLPSGFSLVVEGPGAVGEAPTIAFYTGQDGEPDDTAAALVAELDRVLLSSAAAAERFRSRWPQADARVMIVRPPLLGAWSGGSREALRTQLRARLGLPDRVRLVLGIGPLEDASGLVGFARLASLTCAQRTDVRFVWLGAREPKWERIHWLGVGLPCALRHLYLVADMNYQDWLLAADAYIGCRTAGVFDAGVLEALASGLPVAVDSRTSLPDMLRSGRCADLVAEASGQAAVDWLKAAILMPVSADADIALRTQQCWDAATVDKDLMEAFRESLGAELDTYDAAGD